MRRSTFDLSHEHKLSTDMGYLVPMVCEEVLPGDTFIGQTSLLCRVAPLVNPVMHRVELRVHHWYVPTRLVWPEFEDWITGKDETAQKPSVTPSTMEETWLSDHMGIPPVPGMPFDATPVRAYNMIWNEFYRDQDLMTERDQDDLTLARICWEKDYFTVARPQPQQGDAVSFNLPMTDAPVTGIGSTQGSPSTNITLGETGDGSITDSNYPYGLRSHQTNSIAIKTTSGGVPDIYAALSQQNIGIDIDELRRAIALQRFAEARMRYGSRYVDYLKFLGVNPSDGRLDRPEFIGGGKQNINFSEVLATAEGATTQVGDMFGHGVAGLRSRRYRKMFEEHGWLLTLISARPKTVYMDTVPRKFRRWDPMDHWQRELEVLPWQQIMQNEVHYSGDPDTVFGYVPRYEEYRHGYSHVSGTFRTGPELDWHMARTFQTPPTLNDSFVECTPTDRIYGDVNMAELLINGYNSIKARRLVRKNASLQGI